MFNSFTVNQFIEDPRISVDSMIPSNNANNEEAFVKLLYSKSKVYVHPSTDPNDFISGYLSIVEKVL